MSAPGRTGMCAPKVTPKWGSGSVQALFTDPKATSLLYRSNRYLKMRVMHPPRCMQPTDGSEERGMRVNLDHKASEIEKTPQNQEKTDLSRRTFLARLTILGVGCAAAMTLGVREADATTKTDAADNAKDLADEEARRKATRPNLSAVSIRTTHWRSLLKRAGWSVGRRAGQGAGCVGQPAGQPAGCAGQPAGCAAGRRRVCGIRRRRQLKRANVLGDVGRALLRHSPPPVGPRGGT